jgi:hypothetical protein
MLAGAAALIGALFVFSRADVGFGISRIGHHLTSPVGPFSCHQRKSPTLLDHLVGAAEQRRGDIDAERFSGANEPPGQLNL